MNLINEQDYLSLTVDHILDYALKTFLELTLIFRTCYKCTHIKRIDQLVLQVLRNSAIYDFLCKTLCNSGLTYTWFTDQDRVILGPSAKYLKDTPYLFIPADHRVQFPRSRPLIQIGGELAQEFQFPGGSVVLHVVVIHIINLLFVSGTTRGTDLGSGNTSNGP